MQELTTLLTAITPGDWLLIKNEDSISIVVKPDPLNVTAGQVIIEVGGLHPPEIEANAKLVLLAKEAVPTLLDANAKLGAALTAALELLEAASVVVEPADKHRWATLTDALDALGVQAKS